jgi:ATP-dependent helicase/nuclease subunit A
MPTEAPARDPKQQADDLQRQAADPGANAWVGASAGTGKTKVLVDRVLRLLLGGTRPQGILCLTYTKAAAAEMANRLADKLGGWAVMPQAGLALALAELTGQEPGDATIARARRLFATVLDAPGGITFDTIHAFCQAALKRFPVEAGLPPHFEVMDERDATDMLTEIRRAVMAEAGSAAEGGNPAFAAAFDTVARMANEDAAATLLNTVVGQRERLPENFDGPEWTRDHIEAAVCAALNVEPGQTMDDIRAAAGALAPEAAEDLRRIADAMIEKGTRTVQERGEVIAGWLADRPAATPPTDAYISAFLTQKQQPLATQATKGVVEAEPDALDVLTREALRLVDMFGAMAAVQVAANTTALLTLAREVLRRYSQAKRDRARLDYNDLILTTDALLSGRGRPDVVAWVLYKLDGGIDHILIDEAQDTSPAQWRLIERLTEEFFAGEGAEHTSGGGPGDGPGDGPEGEAARTLFVVGDTKQSIYSFQGARPEAFNRKRAAFEARIEAAVQAWRPVDLAVSFRSTGAVLEFVDEMFKDDAARDGVVFDGAAIEHISSRAGIAGRVEVWPITLPIKGADAGDWPLPTVAGDGGEDVTHQRVRLVRHLAATIKGWIDQKTPLEGRGRPIQAGDILVLVRTRGPFVDELVRALKKADVPVAGVDRMKVAEQLAVQDLIAFAKALLLPQDDLTLATVLRGPLVGLSDDTLFALAHGRKDSLWAALGASEAPDARAAYALLSHWLARVDYEPPYELFAALLDAEGGRQRLLTQLGREAEDPIDEFLSLALTYQRLHAPSVQGFLHWVESGNTEIKREQEQARRNEVRIMTVHGAKGLQAPIVILPDTNTPPGQRDSLLWPAGPEERAVPVWGDKADEAAPVVAARRAADKDRALQEYRRLLFVAMTRAEDRLYVCGWTSGRSTEAKEDSWYALIQRGCDGWLDPAPMDFGEGWGETGYIHATGTDAKADAVAPRAAVAPEELPKELRRPPKPEPTPPMPLAPSRPSEADPPVRSPMDADAGDRAATRFKRGLLIHRLLQSLPDLAPADREAAARRFLGRAVHGLDAAAIDALTAETLAVMAHPAAAPLFGPGSVAEAPLAGRIGDTVISGQIDRLLVEAEVVHIADYKTNRPPPAKEADVAPAYLRQMAAYRALLREIYPKKTISCSLIWTDGANVMPLSDTVLDAYAPAA